MEWKAVSSVIKTLVEEATFEVSGEALTFRAMDPSHIALIDLYWPKNVFEEVRVRQALQIQGSGSRTL